MLDNYVLDDLVNLVAKYFPLLVLVHRSEFISMPRISPDGYCFSHAEGRRISSIFWQKEVKDYF